jgi:hypothetical protein
MPNIVMLDEKLSFQARFLYQLMLMFSWLKGNCFPGQDRLAQIMKVHRNSVLRYLQELKDYGLISWKRRGLNKTNIYYIEKLSDVYLNFDSTITDALSIVHPVAPLVVHQDVPPIVHKEYEVEEKKIKNIKLTLDDEINVSSFSEEAIEIAQELNDLKSIKYYQKLISQKNKGIVNPDDVTDSLNFTRTQIRTAQVDGTKPLSNPAGLFVKTLKDLQEKRKRKDKLSKLETMRAKFLEKSKF